jgi:glutamate-1-semialdehyde 2,1-aminomutase
LTCLGKIIGGGLPVGALGGKREIMEYLAPVGPVYQAGTLSGNPLAMSAGIKTLDILRTRKYAEIEQKASRLCIAFSGMFQKKGISVRINQTGSLFTIFFTAEDVVDYETALKSDLALFAKFFRGMFSSGINLAPAQFEANFVSFAHSDDDIEKTLEAAEKTVKML